MRSLTRLGFASTAVLAVLIGSAASTASAQTMRFSTNVGSFDMRLNPTDDPNLQPLVDNIVAYIGLGRYHFSAINRAPQDFVLQMGTFLGFPNVPDQWATTLFDIERLPSVITDSDGDGQVDFSALSNTRGTVSLALSGAGPNSGTSSFFVNVGDNSGLDSQGFVPFAQIVNMGTVDEIMDLMKLDLGDEAGQSGSLTFSDVPITEDGQIVLIETVRVLQADPNFSFVGPISSALARQAAGSSAAALAAAAASSSSQAAVQAAVAPAIGAVPEPASALLAAIGSLVALRVARHRTP